MDSESYALTSLARDEERLKHLTILPSVGPGQSPSSVVVPLFAQSNGEHVVVLRIGEEKIRTQLLLDTGSSIIWWQCYPCEKCYNQRNIPKYNRMRSRSFESIRCSSNKCDQSQPEISCSPQGPCLYRINYLDNDTTSGILAIEELSSLDGRFSCKVIFGCGTQNPGKYFLGVYAGILGFQNLRITRFPREIYTQFRDKFVEETEDFVPFRVSYWGLDTCYETHTDYLNYFPEVSLHFTDEKVLRLDPQQVLYEAQTGVYCLAFAPFDQRLTILGSRQLETTRLSFNLAEHTVTFSSNDC
ncbi:protein ASPARTIC PROTEASE IN GUARD CELL 1-like [Hevea brasiliensis]|uniref:protein ASPARTIC PROTEASE IN GUARD CELL 1-like n=1 Tax=Hevea brasiliensis TaxID=3981 RepID=UPI0025E3264E|nr:protein ASPARTIC PROTEASE IN GUARD CELL 1-like [Hevea brasiliensis]